ncbi:hypothetical protein I310_02645 [Cryptococcus deuterogattii CA1014]|nr:hypothetical protein I352_02678 [Cryptococcus deuterogattii MMRL2647]KIR73967.1 hypothetical protein I310_02645 [Cryptococcus deuterogattii CA1014]
MFSARRQSSTSSSNSAVIPLNHSTAPSNNNPSSHLALQGPGSGNNDNPSTNAADGNEKQRPRRKVTIVPPVTAACLDDLRSALPTGTAVPHSSQANVLSTPGLPQPTTEASTARKSSKRRRAHTVSVCLPDSAKSRQVGGLVTVESERWLMGLVNHLQNMCNSVMVPYLPQLWTRRPEVQLPTVSDGDVSTAAATGRRSDTTRPRRRSLSLSRFVPSKSASAFKPLAAENDTVPRTAPASSGGANRLSVMEEEPEFQPQDSPIHIQSLPLTLATKQSVPSSTTSLPLPTKPTSLTSSPSSSTISFQRSSLFDKYIKSILSTSTRQKILLALQGFWTFVKTPMGFLTAIYGFAVVFWGAAIVLFLLGWIPTSSKYRQDVWVEISSQVENGLFTVTGVGLIPWRVIDTYRMSVIWTLKRRAERRREKLDLPPIEDENDLPDPQDIPGYIHVLNEKEAAKLRYHQEKFALSQTWYKPHATATHRAFPIRWALWNTILMDGNSFFQCILCGYWHERPAWTTGCLIPLSFLCGIGAAVLIYCGSAKTKKHQAVSEKLRQAMGIPIAIGQPAIGYPNVGEDSRSKERGEEGDDGDEDGIVEEGRRGERARAQVERAPDGGVMVGVGSGAVNRERLSGGDERDNEKDEEDDAEEGEAEDRRGVQSIQDSRIMKERKTKVAMVIKPLSIS